MYLLVPRDRAPLFLAPSVHGTVFAAASGHGLPADIWQPVRLTIELAAITTIILLRRCLIHTYSVDGSLRAGGSCMHVHPLLLEILPARSAAERRRARRTLRHRRCGGPLDRRPRHQIEFGAAKRTK